MKDHCSRCAKGDNENCDNVDMRPTFECFVPRDEDVMRDEMAADRLRDERRDERGNRNE